MSLQQEISLPNPFYDRFHEAMLNVVLTGTLLTKEGTRILRPLGLTDAQLNILMLLKYHSKDGEINQTCLGRMLLVNRSNVTGLVDRMEQAGWVTRMDDPADRRVKQIRLTDLGDRRLKEAEQIYRQRLEEVMSALTEEECLQLCTMLERIRARLRGDDRAEQKSAA